MTDQTLLTYLDQSPTAFHATQNAIAMLQEAGFTELKEQNRWQLKPGQGYFVTRNQSSVLAFRAGKPDNGFHLVTAHTDSPAPKLKLEGMACANGMLRIPIQCYGGDIHSTWIDRPLGVAGRLACKDTSNRIHTVCVNFAEPLAVIPNLAIHLNRSSNSGLTYNEQSQMAALFGQATPQDFLDKLMTALPAPQDCILDAELLLYDLQPATITGLRKDLISSPRLDNLTSCHAAVMGLIGATPQDWTQVIFLADNEEIGSRTPQGAQSAFLKTILDRIVVAFGGTLEDTYRALSQSTLLSMDSAHAVHPNYADKHDPAYAPKINGGVVIKSNADYKYCTTAATAAAFRTLCEQNGIPVQDFINRSDMPCGSTIGPVCAANLGIQGLDIGTPLWAMHSCREVGGLKDHEYLIKAAKVFL